MCETVPTEVGGMAICSKTDALLVEDIAIVKQVVSFATVAFDDDAYAVWADSMYAKADLPPVFCQRVWIHTHPAGMCVPSGMDESTFADKFGGADWSVMFIMAKGGITYCRMQFQTKSGPRQVMLPVRVDYSLPFPASNQAAWDEEIKCNVTQVQPYEYPAYRGMPSARPVFRDEPVVRRHYPAQVPREPRGRYQKRDRKEQRRVAEALGRDFTTKDEARANRFGISPKLYAVLKGPTLYLPRDGELVVELEHELNAIGVELAATRDVGAILFEYRDRTGSVTKTRSDSILANLALTPAMLPQTLAGAEELIRIHIVENVRAREYHDIFGKRWEFKVPWTPVRGPELQISPGERNELTRLRNLSYTEPRPVRPDRVHPGTADQDDGGGQLETGFFLGDEDPGFQSGDEVGDSALSDITAVDLDAVQEAVTKAWLFLDLIRRENTPTAVAASQLRTMAAEMVERKQDGAAEFEILVAGLVEHGLSPAGVLGEPSKHAVQAMSRCLTRFRQAGMTSTQAENALLRFTTQLETQPISWFRDFETLAERLLMQGLDPAGILPPDPEPTPLQTPILDNLVGP